ncbi:MAG: DUF4249 domain-containing protein [Bacteroidia bacterium]
MKHILFILVVSLTITGCQKIISIPVPVQESRLVVWGFLNPDEEISVTISQTAPVFENHPKNLSVKIALPALYENGIFRENLVHVQDGIYQSPSGIVPVVGKTYRVSVEAAGFAKIESPDEKVPEKLKLTSFVFQDSAISAINEGRAAGVLTLIFNDDPLNNNYYGVQIIPFETEDEPSGSLDWLLGYDETSQELCGVLSSGIGTVISDVCLNSVGGDTVRVAIETSYDSSDGFRKYHHLEVFIYSISASYYSFLQSQRTPEGLELAFSDPGSLFSNISGGYGVWGTFAVFHRRVDL